MSDVERELELYGYKLGWFIDNKKLPEDWFARPDHVTVVAENITEFEELVKTPKKERIVRDLGQEERFEVVAKLSGVMAVANLGYVRWIDIIEPFPEQQITGLVGFHDIKFYHQDFDNVRYLLGVRGIPYELLEHDNYAEINAYFDAELNTFRIVNRPIEQVTDEKMRRGDARLLDQAA